MAYLNEVIIGYDAEGFPIEMTVEGINTLTDVTAGTPTDVTIRGQIKGWQ